MKQVLFLLSLVVSLVGFAQNVFSVGQAGSQGQNGVYFDSGLPAIPKDGPHVHVSLWRASEKSTGQSYLISRFSVEHGWHIYWLNPGDSGQPPRAQWTAPAAVHIQPWLWPVPEKQPVGPLINFGYSGQIDFLSPIDGALPNSSIEGHFNWLVCKDVCVPEKQTIKGTWNQIKDDSQSLHDDLARLPKELSHQVDVSFEDAGNVIRVKVQDPPTSFSQFEFFFPDTTSVIDNTAPQKITGANPFTLELQKLSADVKLGPTWSGLIKTARGTFKVQGRTIAANATLGTANPRANGFWVALFFALLGGILLNLMPCVFPILSIKAIAFMRGHESRRTAVRHGLAYTAGVVVSFLALAGILLLFKSLAHQELGWGFQLQSPTFVTVLVFILFTMALNLTGLFEIEIGSASNVGQKFASLPGDLGAFFTGLLAVIVATPCTAPFMGTALGYALSASALNALAVFAALGLGLALPYLLLTTIPRAVLWLPKPGPWMVAFRQLMGFFLLATCLWLLWILGLQVSLNQVIIVLAGLLLFAFGLWIWSDFKKWGWRVLAVVFVAAGLTVGIKINYGPAGGPRQQDAWQPFDPAKAEEIVKQGHGVFVDFTAAWCVTCKVNEAVVLNTEDAQELFRAQHVTLMRGDWTKNDPLITETLRHFGRDGVPLYVYYPPGGLEPQILPQILSLSILRHAIR